MNKNALKSKMALRGDTGVDLAAAIGMSRASLSAKMNSTKGAEFTQGEIKSIKDRYSLTAAEVDDIFFGQKVS